MSGGSYDYEYQRIEAFAEHVYRDSTTPLHRAFAHHLVKVAKAAHDLEYVHSGDKSEGSEVAAIEAVVSKTQQAEYAVANIHRAIAEAQKTLKQLEPKAKKPKRDQIPIEVLTQDRERQPRRTPVMGRGRK